METQGKGFTLIGEKFYNLNKGRSVVLKKITISELQKLVENENDSNIVSNTISYTSKGIPLYLCAINPCIDEDTSWFCRECGLQMQQQQKNENKDKDNKIDSLEKELNSTVAKYTGLFQKYNELSKKYQDLQEKHETTNIVMKQNLENTVSKGKYESLQKDAIDLSEKINKYVQKIGELEAQLDRIKKDKEEKKQVKKKEKLDKQSQNNEDKTETKIEIEEQSIETTDNQSIETTTDNQSIEAVIDDKFYTEEELNLIKQEGYIHIEFNYQHQIFKLITINKDKNGHEYLRVFIPVAKKGIIENYVNFVTDTSNLNIVKNRAWKYYPGDNEIQIYNHFMGKDKKTGLEVKKRGRIKFIEFATEKNGLQEEHRKELEMQAIKKGKKFNRKAVERLFVTHLDSNIFNCMNDNCRIESREEMENRTAEAKAYYAEQAKKGVKQSDIKKEKIGKMMDAVDKDNFVVGVSSGYESKDDKDDKEASKAINNLGVGCTCRSGIIHGETGAEYMDTDWWEGKE